MRRANGEGTISKRKGKRRKPWRVEISTGNKTINGNCERMPLGDFVTRSEAEMALAKYKAKPIEKPNITLKELHDEWQPIKYASGISKQTKDSYNAAWRQFALLENYRVKDIRTGQLQLIVDNCPNKTSSKKDIRTLARLLWNYAVQNDIVDKNYAEFIVIPAEKKTEQKSFNTIEQKKIEDAAAQGVKWADTIMILNYTGFRVSELLGLTPFNVIMDDKGHPAFFRGGLKTVAGKDRIVPIHKKIVPYVEKWLSKGGNFIICHDDGRRVRYNDYREYFIAAVAEIGTRPMTPHATRHTWFSKTDDAGISEATRQIIGGHADPEMTRHYTHKELGELSAAINTMK